MSSIKMKGKIKIVPKHVSLNKIIQETVFMFKSDLTGKEIQLNIDSFDSGEIPYFIFNDPHRIK